MFIDAIPAFLAVMIIRLMMGTPAILNKDLGIEPVTPCRRAPAPAAMMRAVVTKILSDLLID